MPSLTSLPLTARGPVSWLSTPILIGSFDVWARAADVSRRKARTTSPTRPVHRLTRFFASMLFPPASLVSGGGQDTGPVKAASTALVFGRRCGRTHTPARRPDQVSANGVVLAPLCRNALHLAINGL